MERLQVARAIGQLGVAEDQHGDRFTGQGIGQIGEDFEDGHAPLVLINFERRSGQVLQHADIHHIAALGETLGGGWIEIRLEDVIPVTDLIGANLLAGTSGGLYRLLNERLTVFITGGEGRGRQIGL
jgi:hypothetical protein